MNKIIALALLLLLNTSICQGAPGYEYVIEEYVVQENDTLEKIAGEFIIKNTYGEREIREFTEGIKELNCLLSNEIETGQILKISYWTKKG